jgi:hypothetical protein
VDTRPKVAAIATLLRPIPRRAATLVDLRKRLTCDDRVAVRSHFRTLSLKKRLIDLEFYYCDLFLPSEPDPSENRVRRDRMPAYVRPAVGAYDWPG